MGWVPNCRILAILFIAVALGLTVRLSLYSWDHYQHDATAMVLDYDYKHFEITKPAVTICLDEPVNKTKFPTVFEKFGVADTPEARAFFVFISKPSYVTLNKTPIYKGTPPEKWIKIIQELYVYFEITQWEEDESEHYNISTSNIITEKGMCSTVFGTYSDYLTLDYWLSDNWTVLPEERLSAWTYSDRNELLTMAYNPGSSEETLHYPADIAGYHKWYPNKASGITDIKVVVQRMQSSNEMKKLSESQRPCNFPDDGNLKMWPVYTRNLCLMECRFNLMRRKCGCYPYFARPMKGIPICNVTQLHCIGNIARSIVSMQIDGSNICNCPVDCNTARYGTSSIGSNSNPVNATDTGSEFLKKMMLNVNVEFPFNIYRYEVFFGFNDFLVSVGGAAGLFLGASIISFIEILYYVTLRLFWYRKNIFKYRPD